jgi:hypothetical protein
LEGVTLERYLNKGISRESGLKYDPPELAGS